jgi:hypothetical protein
VGLFPETPQSLEGEEKEAEFSKNRLFTQSGTGADREQRTLFLAAHRWRYKVLSPI